MSFSKAIFIFAINLIMMHTAYAGKVFPHGCEVTGFSYENNYLIVNPYGKQTFYLIQNRTNLPIELKRFDAQEVFMSPSLAIKLDPSNWAALSADVENLHFQCLSKSNETSQKVDCSLVLDVCEYPRVKFAESNMGNYWVSTNKTQSEVINESANKGIYLRW